MEDTERASNDGDIKVKIVPPPSERRENFEQYLIRNGPQVDKQDWHQTTVRLPRWEKNVIDNIDKKSKYGNTIILSLAVRFGLELVAGTFDHSELNERLADDEVDRISDVIYKLGQTDAQLEDDFKTNKSGLLDESDVDTRGLTYYLSEQAGGRLGNLVEAAGLIQSSVVRHLLAIALARSDHVGDNEERAELYEEQFVDRLRRQSEKAEVYEQLIENR